MNFFDNTIGLLTVIALLLLCLALAILSVYFWRQKSNQEKKHIEKNIELDELQDQIDYLSEKESNNPFEYFQENAYQQLPDAIIILNERDQITYLNIAAEEMLEYRLRSVMGKHYPDVFNVLDVETKRPIPITQQKRRKELDKRGYVLSTKSGQDFMVECHNIESVNLSDDSEEEQKKVILLRNITEKKALESRLSNLENFDAQTRMFKRLTFDAQVKQVLDSSQKHNSNHLLAYFSIDQFQFMNDTIGYVNSDNLIEKVADIIKGQMLPSIDIAGRMSASEFAVVFSERTLPEVLKSLQSIVKSVGELNFKARGKKYSTSVSAGFVVIGTKTSSSTRAITEANIACNLASKHGGNQVCVYRQDNSEIKKLEGNYEWVVILKDALQNNKFKMQAQAIHALKAEEYAKPFNHYECLLRLSDDLGNPISPDEFISAAEYYSMMPTIDRWVVRHVFKQIKSLKDEMPLPVFAINLSGQSLNDRLFLNFVKSEIAQSGVNPRMLCFEITEQVAVEDLSMINNFIASLKAIGCSFSLDDFGTGVSSYGYLRSLDVDYLKIDGSFVKHIANDEVAKTMVQSINQVGHTMDLQIIAEYVENEEIIQILRDMGVDYGQGYGIAKPVPIEEVILRHKANEKHVGHVN